MSSSAPTNPGTGPGDRRFSRRRLLKRGLTAGAVALAGGAWACGIEPFWIDEHDVPMPLRGLPTSLDGFRILHLSDLHASDNVPFSYLQRVVRRVNQLKPDLVVITGDLVTHALEWVGPVSSLVGQIRAPVVATFGNHDYHTIAYSPEPIRWIADTLERQLTANGATVLRNAATSVDRPDGKIWIVGLEDLWSGRFAPASAFAGLDTRHPIIALSHNPDTAQCLDGYGTQWTLSGHTHGGQVRLPFYGAVWLNVKNRRFEQGQFQLPHSRLYVSRGIGYYKRVRFLCRPEMPTFVLRPA